ncbi:MAG: hypothetical protein IPP64_02975 [Bacteroidetes bacterium]|nr:hypothetical protein [Bacteroidota bacterium]
MTNTKILLPFFILLTLLTIFSFNIPFFWDSTFFSSLSVHFYNNGFDGFIAPEALDTGGFPLYSTYLTWMWKCFGKTLIVSHCAMLPFMLGLLYEFFKLCKRYLEDKAIVWALILFCIEPVFLTQSMLMGYDIIIAYFFLLSLNALYSKRSILFSIALLLLCLISIRGIMLASALFMIDSIQHKKIDFVLIRKYIPTFLFLSFWAYYHNQQTGWLIFSPYREDNAEELATGFMMVRQFIYILWKILDNGRIALWLVLMFFGFVYLKKGKTEAYRELMINLFLPLLMLSLFMIFLFNPIGHKYFLVVFILLNIAVVYLIQQIIAKKSRIILYTLLSVCLLAGNFIIYPQRYGNAWDSSLKVISYFPLEHKMRTYIKIKQIAPETIGTQFPLTNNFHSSTLADTPDVPYLDIETNPINSFHYFLYSNIINSGRIDDLENVKKNWVVAKEYKSGMIELILYKNPNF